MDRVSEKEREGGGERRDRKIQRKKEKLQHRRNIVTNVFCSSKLPMGAVMYCV